MDISKAIEQYVGRKVDFLTEVIIMKDGTHGGKSYIHAWNLPEKKPTIKELEAIYDENELTDREKEKIKNKKISLQLKIDAGEKLGYDMSEEIAELQELMNL